MLATDTVYGLAASSEGPEPARRLYGLKGRAAGQPTALVAASIEVLLECLPELGERTAAILGALLPGPYTLVVANPARRFRWLSETRPDALGVRVPVLAGPAADVVRRVGTVVMTSANLPGGPDPRRLEDVPAELTAGVAIALDGGELPGIASTVIDVTGPVPVVIRAGAANPTAALARIGTAHT